MTLPECQEEQSVFFQPSETCIVVFVSLFSCTYATYDGFGVMHELAQRCH